MCEHDIKLFEKIRESYPTTNMTYVPNIIKKKKSGPKQRDITRDTQIKGNCNTENCENQFGKSFRNVVDPEKGPYCISCSKKRANQKRKETKSSEEYKPILEETNKKREKTCEERYGNKNAIASRYVRNKILETFDSKYDGALNPSQIQEVQENKKQKLIDSGNLVYSLKFLEELLDKYGAMLIDDIKEIELGRDHDITFICKCGTSNSKSFITIEKYGAFCRSCQAIHEKEKSIETNMKIRGVPHSSNDPLVISKIKSTNMKNWGTEKPQELEEIKQITRDTCQKNLGVDYPMQSKVVQETARLNNQKKYNENHPMHVAEIAEKASRCAYKSYDYKFPSGRIDRIQGTEKYTLDHLLSIGIHEDDIITSRKYVPDIRYIDENGVECRYYVDAYIKSQNLCVESKSTWTAEKNRDEMFLKQNAVKNAGYRCEIWVYDGKGNLVEYYL